MNANICVYFSAKSDILKLLSGEISPTSGVVSLAKNKRVVLFKPTIPKESHIYTVKSFLEQSMSPDDLKNSSAVVAKVSTTVYCDFYLFRM